MDLDTLMRAILAILPLAQAGEDLDGQLVIYTGMRVNAADTVEPMPEEG